MSSLSFYLGIESKNIFLVFYGFHDPTSCHVVGGCLHLVWKVLGGLDESRDEKRK